MPGASGIKAGQAYVTLSVDDAMDAGLKSGNAKLASFRRGVEEVNESWTKSIGGGVKAIRTEQRESGELALERVLGQGTEGIASLFGGGVAAVGIDLLSKGMKNAADEASRVRKELAEGKIGPGDVAERMLAAVPIFGQVWQAGRSIREAITGEQLAIDLVNEAAKETVTYYDAQLARVRTIRGILQDMKSEGAHAAIEQANVGQDQYTQTANTIGGEMQDRSDTYKQRLDQKRKEAADAYDKQIEAQKALAANAEAQFNSKNYGYTPEQVMAAATEGGKSGLAFKPPDDLVDAARNLQYQQQQLQKLEMQKGNEVGAGGPVEKGFAADEAAKNATDAAKLQDNARRQWEEYGKVVRDGIEAAGEEMASAQIEDLKREGKTAEAQRLQIEQDAKRKVEAIMRGAADQAKAIGAVSPWDPRYQQIMAVAGAQAGAVAEDAAAKSRTAAQAEFEQRAQKEEQLAELKAEGIANTYDREKAGIDARYRYEVETAHAAGRETADIVAKWNQERTNLEQRHQQEVKDATENIDEQIAQQRVQLEKRGLAQRLALIDLERQRALKREADPATSAGIGADKINELYDLQKELAEQGSGGTVGGFNGLALQAMFGGQQKAADPHTAATAKNTARIAKLIEKGIQRGDRGMVFG